MARMRAIMILTSVVLSACGGAEPASDLLAPGNPVTVESKQSLAAAHVSVVGSLAQGRNVLAVDFDPPSTVLDDATTFMPVHGHGSTYIQIAKSGTGYELRNVVFSMPGLWTVTLDVHVAGKADTAEITADVP
jgi:hypothetical protein